MNKITFRNYRCFHDKQTAHLAPLTLLVGENSTGKTSFLAMIRALCDIAYSFRLPDFKENPYDLGSFDEIAHHRGAGGGQADTFEAGFSTLSEQPGGMASNVDYTFGKSGTTPFLKRRHLSEGETWIDETFAPGEARLLRVGTSRGTWDGRGSTEAQNRSHPFFGTLFPPAFYLEESLSGDREAKKSFLPVDGAPPLRKEDRNLLQAVAYSHVGSYLQQPYASAPVRSKPRRTYDPSRPTPDPEGDYVPMYLADVFSRDKDSWVDLKAKLEGFGKISGLFDEISIKRLGKRGSEPFQVQVRKAGGGRVGLKRNLIDVGYGVSQALPVITELLRQDAPSRFLLQQPEVHLHPSAQAALGTLFCQIASVDRQLVVETHSDHLIDRVRMDVRDKKSALKPDDVSLLFFERGALDVHIHSLKIDEEGNIVGTPDNYRRFFMEETARSLGI